ncbi:hypothetical protein G7Y89_g9301 [Cudoniella acicularis]|uniref:Heterokaryon incompatibility domain-containing protein n=1 Tax=Cudoniella acicularis TaxID=354080 RepID=A0A8H4W209_9HELO|nr:hypothetical protein G7Y89_g9301 [Cudoniella acicularis]
MSKLCTICTDIFRGKRTVSHNNIHGSHSHVTNDGFALHDSDSDSNIEGSSSSHRDKVRHFYPHYPSFSEFELSAQGGCHLCKVLLAQLSAKQVEELRDYARIIRIKKPYRAKMWYAIWTSRDSPVDESDDPPLVLQVRVRYVRPDVRRLVRGSPAVDCRTMTTSMSVVLDLVRNIENIDVPLNNTLPESTSSDLCLQLKTQWISSCNSKHTSCRSSRDDNWLPTRLIDVGVDDDDNNNRRLRLCESKSLPEGTRYISLSHCWGLNKILRCLGSTIDQFKQSIPFSNLSKTFQDAINITRRFYADFGVRHIWIDSLCIIQDSHEDWIYEASQMGRVYANAWCNIAATASRDGSGGCFRDRDPLLSQLIKMEASWDGICRGTYYAFDTGSMDRNVSEAPLNTRGWVVQERLLSPRIIHFANDQIYWECLEMDASEAFPGGMPRQVVGRFKDLDPRSAGQKARIDRGLKSDPLLNTYSIWSKIVDQYTRCNLTKASDKMVALSALARQVQAQFGPEIRYVAGMWDKYVASQLFWQVSSGESVQVNRPDEYRAPSWSWMSVDGHVSVPEVDQANQREIVLEIISLHVTTAGPDEFTGPITGGYLTVRGILVRASMTYDKETEGAVLMVNGNEMDWFISWDVEFGPGQERHLYCLPIRKSPYGNSYDGLFLVPVLPAKGIFRRWGYFSAFQLGGGEFERGEKLDEVEYQEFDSVDKYKITII